MTTTYTTALSELDEIQLAGFHPCPLLSGMSLGDMINECVSSVYRSYDNPCPVVRRKAWDHACQLQAEMIHRMRMIGSGCTPCETLGWANMEDTCDTMRVVYAMTALAPPVA